MKRTILTALAILAISAMQVNAEPKKKKEPKVEPKIEERIDDHIKINNPAKQLGGEWIIESFASKSLSTSNLPCVFFDFNNGKQFYVSNGDNSINGNFVIKGNDLSFLKIKTMGDCDKAFKDVFANVKRLKLTEKDGVEYMQLLDSKSFTLMELKRHNMDVLNGAWTVAELYGDREAAKSNMRMVLDIQLKSVHADSGYNIINGTLNIDPAKNHAIQFEDLRSSGYKPKGIDNETNLLLSMEEVEHYKILDNDRIEFKDKAGQAVMILKRLNIKKK